jgi:hypothetical protein
VKVRLDAHAILIWIYYMRNDSSRVKCYNGVIVNVFYILVGDPAAIFILYRTNMYLSVHRWIIKHDLNLASRLNYHSIKPDIELQLYLLLNVDELVLDKTRD